MLVGVSIEDFGAATRMANGLLVMPLVALVLAVVLLRSTPASLVAFIVALVLPVAGIRGLDVMTTISRDGQAVIDSATTCPPLMKSNATVTDVP